MAALPLAAVEKQLQEKRLVCLQVQGWPLRRDLLVVQHRDKYVFRALAQFLEVMRTAMKTRIGNG